MLQHANRSPLSFGYWLIGAAFVAQFVSVGVQNYVFGAFMTPMIEEFGWSRTEYSLPRTAGQFVMAFTGFIIGTYVDRYGGRPFMLAGIVVLCASLLALSGVENLLQWVLLNGLVLTIGAAMIGNLVVNVTLAKWFVEFRGRAIAFSAMGVSFAGVVLTPVMTLIIDAWGWRAAWQVLAIGAAVLIVPVSTLMRRAPEDYGLHPDGKSDTQVAAGDAQQAMTDFAKSLTRQQALRTMSFYLLVLAFGLFLVTISVMLLQTIPYMTDAGYSRPIAALMITVASIPAFLSKPIWGILIDRLNAKPLAAAGAAITGVAMFIIVFSVQVRADIWVYSGFFLLGCGWGGMIPLQEVIWASFFGRRYLGAVRSAALPFSFLISAGAPLAASYYFDIIGNYDGILLAVAASNLLSAAMLLLIPPPRAQPGSVLSHN
ncbi:MAG: MFS transporter [Pseudomonadales bacterium]|jgi:MFS family permease|nr:MFS transporter [Pseudomonadales bacterium]